MSDKVFQLVPSEWPQTVLSAGQTQQHHSQTSQGCGSLRERICHCFRLVAFTRAEGAFLALLATLLVASVTTRERQVNSAYMALAQPAAVVVRHWLGEAADNSGLANGNRSNCMAATHKAVKDALFTTVLVEISSTAALLAGGVAVGLAILHSCLAWHNLAAEAKGR